MNDNINIKESSKTSAIIVEYAKATQDVCMCLSLSIFLIVLFILSPLNKFLLTSIFGKVIIILLLGFTIFYNIKQTGKFSKDFDVSLLLGDWSTIKTNIAYSYIFTVFLLILLVTVLKNLFLKG
jgi:hypothetical protein